MPVIRLKDKGMVVRFPDDMPMEEIERAILTGVYDTPVLHQGSAPSVMDRITGGVRDLFRPADPGVGLLTPEDRAAFEPAGTAPALPKIPAPDLGGAWRTVENVGQVYPALETAATAITSLYGLPAAGIAGLAALPFGADAAEKAMAATQEALVYQPQTQRGQELTQTAFLPFEALHKLAQRNADYVMEQTGDPDLAALAATGIESSILLLGPMKNGLKRLGEMTRKNAALRERLQNIPDRDLVVQSLAETLERNPGMAEADLIRMSDQYYREAMQRRGAGTAGERPAATSAEGPAAPKPEPAVAPQPKPKAEPQTELGKVFQSELEAQRPKEPTGFAAFQKRIQERLQRAGGQVDARASQAMAALEAVEGGASPEAAATVAKSAPVPGEPIPLPSPEGAAPRMPDQIPGRVQQQMGVIPEEPAQLPGPVTRETRAPESPQADDLGSAQAIPLPGVMPQMSGQIPGDARMPTGFSAFLERVRQQQQMTPATDAAAPEATVDPTRNPREPEVTRAKEPWEMTLAEFDAAERANIDQGLDVQIQNLENQKIQPRPRIGMGGTRVGWKVSPEDAKEFNSGLDEKISAIRQEKEDLDTAVRQQHMNELRVAHQEGRPIPEEVLRDYKEEINPKYRPPEPAGKPEELPSSGPEPIAAEPEGIPDDRGGLTEPVSIPDELPPEMPERLMTFDEYSRSKGIPSFPPADSGLTSPSGRVSGATERSAERRRASELADWQQKRDALKKEYDEAVARGEINPQSDERAEIISRGEGERAQAAKRALEKRKKRRTAAQPEPSGFAAFRERVRQQQQMSPAADATAPEPTVEPTRNPRELGDAQLKPETKRERSAREYREFLAGLSDSDRAVLGDQIDVSPESPGIAKIRLEKALAANRKGAEGTLDQADPAEPAPWVGDFESGLDTPINPWEALTDDYVEQILPGRILDAAKKLTGGEPNVRVRMSDLRKEIGDVPLKQFHNALTSLQAEERAVLMNLDNPRELGPADRAVEMTLPGGFTRHIVYFSDYGKAAAAPAPKKPKAEPKAATDVADAAPEPSGFAAFRERVRGQQSSRLPVRRTEPGSSDRARRMQEEIRRSEREITEMPEYTKMVEDRINRKYDRIIRLPEVDYQDPLLDLVEQGEISAGELDAALAETSDPDFVRDVQAVLAEHLGDLKETFRYEGDSEGAAIEKWLDGMLSVAARHARQIRVGGRKFTDASGRGEAGAETRRLSDIRGVGRLDDLKARILDEARRYAGGVPGVRVRLSSIYTNLQKSSDDVSSADFQQAIREIYEEDNIVNMDRIQAADVTARDREAELRLPDGDFYHTVSFGSYDSGVAAKPQIEFPLSRVEAAYRHISTSPRGAAMAEKSDFDNTVDRLKTELEKHTPENRADEIPGVIDQFKRDYIEKREPVWLRREEGMSPKVAGASKFNKKQAGRRNSAIESSEDRFRKEIGRLRQEAMDATGATENKIQKQKAAEIEKENAREAAAQKQQEMFDSIEVGDLVDIGGNSPVEVVKKNPKTIVTPLGSKYRANEIFGVTKPKATPEATPKATPDLPSKPVTTGAETTSYTADNKPILSKYAVVEADELITSHDAESFRENPEYPQALQNRDRSGKVLQMQVNTIKANPIFEKVADSGSTSTGAPIVGSDLVVESGNGRTMGLTGAYRRGNAETYRQRLIDNAAKYGLEPGKIQGMRSPVLVRVRQSTPMDVLGRDDRGALAREMGRDETAGLSAAESAKDDVYRVPDSILDLYNVESDGNILSASNRDFVSEFIRIIGKNEGVNLINKATGRISKAGVDRIQNFIFSKAYQNDDIISWNVEDADPDVRNILNGLAAAAGDFAKARVVDSTLGEYSQVMDALMDGIHAVRSSRINSRPLDQILDPAQIDMFGEESAFSRKEYDPGAKEIAYFIDKSLRSGKKLGNAFSTFGNEIYKSLLQSRDGQLFETKFPTSEEIIDEGIRRAERGDGKRSQGQLFDVAEENLDFGRESDRRGREANASGDAAHGRDIEGESKGGRGTPSVKERGGTTLYSGIPIHRFGEAKRAMEKLYEDHVGTPVWEWLTELPERAGQRSKIVDAINRGLITDYRKPEEYIRLRDDLEKKLHNAKQKALALGEFLQTFPRAEQVRISQIIKGSITTNPDRYKKVFEIQKEFEELERDLKELGVLGKDTYLTKLSRKELADKTNRIREIDRETETLKRKLRPIITTKWTTRKLAETVTESVTSKQEALGEPELKGGKYKARVTKWSKLNEDRIREALATRGFSVVEADQMIERVKESVIPIEGKNISVTEIRERIERVVEKTLLKIKETTKTYDPQVMAKARGGIIRDMNRLRKERNEIVDRIRRHYKTSGEMYLRRAYEMIENEQKFMDGLRKLVRPRMFKGYTERRKDLPWEYRKKVLKEIQEAPYLVAKGLSEEYHDRELVKYFSKIAENPKWAVSPEEYARNPEKWEGFKPLPGSEKLGRLSGWLVDPYIWDDLNQTAIHRNAMGKAYDSALRLWKMGKVVYNPAAQMRNIMSNVILADWAGLPPERVDVWARAAKDMLSKSGYYAEALETPLLGTEWAGTEVKQFLKEAADLREGTIFDHMTQWVKKVADLPGQGYQAIEQWGKVAVFAKARMDGMSIDEAYRHAEKSLFNYNKVPPAIRWAKRWYSPFITFTYKALPRFGETAVRRPWKVLKYLMLMKAVEEIGRLMMGESEEELDREKRVLPEYMRKSVGLGQISHLRLPYKDAHGRSKYLDLSYILPWGDVAEQWGQSRVGFRTLLPNNPLFIVPAEIGMNRVMFTGRDLTDNDLDQGGEYALEIGKHIWRQAMPSLAGSWSYNKLMAAYYGDTDWAGRERSMTEAIFDVALGIKIRSIAYNEERGKRMRDLRDKIGDARRRFSSDYRRITLTQQNRPGHEERVKKLYDRLYRDIDRLTEKIEEMDQ